MTRVSLKTGSRCALTDITAEVSRIVTQSDIAEGLCCVYSPHTTAGITINENADPSVKRDILVWMDQAVPERGNYTHAEGNSDAHIKTLMTGLSAVVPVSDAKLVLGTWQGIYFCEYDGPRNRQYCVQVIGTNRKGDRNDG